MATYALLTFLGTPVARQDAGLAYREDRDVRCGRLALDLGNRPDGSADISGRYWLSEAVVGQTRWTVRLACIAYHEPSKPGRWPELELASRTEPSASADGHGRCTPTASPPCSMRGCSWCAAAGKGRC